MSNKSKNMIAEALMRQLGVKPFEDISVSDICANASLARKTFYNNFGSKESVVEHIADKLMSVYQKMLAEEKADSLKAMAYLYFCFGEKYKKVLCVFIENNLFYLFVKQFDKLLPSINALVFGDRINITGDDNLKYVFAFNSAGVNRLLEIWIENGQKETPKEMGDIYNSITK